MTFTPKGTNAGAFVPRCYIAGPMTGYPDHNYPAFHKAAAEMRALGWEVINPAENHGGRTDLPREEYFRTDIPQLISCDAVCMLPGWENSEGARLEFAIARACNVRTVKPGDDIPFALKDDNRCATSVATSVVGDYAVRPYHARWYSWPREAREAAAAVGFSGTGKDRVRDEISSDRFMEFCQGVVSDGLQDTFGFVFDGFPDASPAKPDPFNVLLDEMRALHDKKKQDYTGGEHPLANYANSGESIGVSAVASMFSRMNEKVFRLKQLHKTGAAPQNESVIDSYMDVAILSLLSILALTPGSGYEQEAA